MRATMPPKMISEMPFPIPNSDICSPSHMMKAVPAVMDIIVIKRKLMPGLSTTPGPSMPFSSP